MRRALLLLLALLAPQAALADDVAATAPTAVSVTIYRSPTRGAGAITLSQLGGFAVVTETRTVRLPAGTSRLRFEGVVDGIIPESAIVTGLPGGVIEKNRDAALLSPSALLRAAIGSALTLRRADKATGKVTAVPARITSASDQGITFATAGGIEALRCSGLPETFAYTRGTEGLSALPTLSVRTRSARAVTATVKLTYLAEAFDWSASYTAHINPDGRTLDLGGWITLANGNSVSLRQATTQIVAGGLNREYFRRFFNPQPQVIARCWPLQRTSEVPLRAGQPYELVSPYLGQSYDRLEESDAIMVTAQRRGFALPPPPPAPMAMMAPPPPVAEQLGDLKLYRVPEPTTVAARQMKQTRLVEQPGVRFERVFLAETSALWGGGTQRVPVIAVLRTVNDKAHGLGLPLPAGAVLVDQDQHGRTLMLGEPALADRAEGEKIELRLGDAPDITVTRKSVAGAAPRARPAQSVEIVNAASGPVTLELKIFTGGNQRVVAAGQPPGQIFGKQDGQPFVRLTVPGNDTVTLSYSVEG